MLNEDLLEEATRLSGERTYSRTVERALEDFVRRARARRILELAGSGLWEGKLSVVREDRGDTGSCAVVLVDTSVWIAVFRRKPVVRMEQVVEFEDVVTCLPVIQEVLQGFRDERAFQLARDAMYALPIVEAPLAAAVVDDAVGLVPGGAPGRLHHPVGGGLSHRGLRDAAQSRGSARRSRLRCAGACLAPPGAASRSLIPARTRRLTARRGRAVPNAGVDAGWLWTKTSR